ncbi:MAG TPA: hypothetical protein VIG06_25850 [Kofleriaceae bacterium]|jgi:hypothetical protein
MRSTWVALLWLVACRDGSPPNEQPARRPAEDTPRERVFTPSPAEVRSVGPYAITAGGVGLYALGAEMRTVLAMLPAAKAPVDQLEIDGVLKYKVVPPDAERILVGFDPSGRAGFVAVVAPDIAMVEGGYGVGTAVEEVRKGLGPDVLDRAVRDPHLLLLGKLPNARFVVDDERVIAIVVTPEARRSEAPPAAAEADAPACERAAEILAGSLPEPHDELDEARASYGCFTGAAPEIALAEGDEVVVYGGEPGRLRRTTSVAAPGLLFAGALDVDRDGKKEIVSVAERRTGDSLAARIVVWRGEGGGRLTPVADKEVYRMTSDSARWVGARLKDVSFLIEVRPAGTSSVEVGGLYLERGDGQVHTVAPLVVETMAVRPRRPTPTATGGNTGGASTAPPGPDAARDGGKGGEAAGGEKAPPPAHKETGKEDAKKADPAPAPRKTRGAKRDASDM